jgi:hypothetical protein
LSGFPVGLGNGLRNLSRRTAWFAKLGSLSVRPPPPSSLLYPSLPDLPTTSAIHQAAVAKPAFWLSTLVAF